LRAATDSFILAETIAELLGERMPRNAWDSVTSSPLRGEVR
jgi:hypothetical protein